MSAGPPDAGVFSTIDINQRVRVWLKSFRLKFLPQGVFPVILGSVVAWVHTRQFDLVLFVLALIGSACVQVGLTLLNDTLDYIYGADRSQTMNKNPFTGGSGVLVDGLLHPRDTFTAVVLFYVIAATIGAYLTLRVGIGVFWMGLSGLILSVFYSAKPLRFAFRGVGELAIFLGYGPTITLGAGYLQTGRFSFEVGLASLVPGLLMWSMILVNEIPDYLEDVQANKKNLTVRLGRERARWLYILSLLSVYAIIIAGTAFGAFPLWSLLSIASAPLAFRSFRVVFEHYLTPRLLTGANRAMVLTYTSTMLLFCAGFWLSKAL